MCSAEAEADAQLPKHEHRSLGRLLAPVSLFRDEEGKEEHTGLSTLADGLIRRADLRR
jgi:anti-sigma factor ChrR (cupin superfamily)